MNITSLSGGSNIMVSGTENMTPIDFSMLKKSLDTVETTGAMITQMMEQSVNPNIGSNIDIRL